MKQPPPSGGLQVACAGGRSSYQSPPAARWAVACPVGVPVPRRSRSTSPGHQFRSPASLSSPAQLRQKKKPSAEKHVDAEVSRCQSHAVVVTMGTSPVVALAGGAGTPKNDWRRRAESRSRPAAVALIVYKNNITPVFRPGRRCTKRRMPRRLPGRFRAAGAMAWRSRPPSSRSQAFFEPFPARAKWQASPETAALGRYSGAGRYASWKALFCASSVGPQPGSPMNFKPGRTALWQQSEERFRAQAEDQPCSPV